MSEIERQIDEVRKREKERGRITLDTIPLDLPFGINVANKGYHLPNRMEEERDFKRRNGRHPFLLMKRA